MNAERLFGQHAALQVCGAARLPFDSLKVRRSA